MFAKHFALVTWLLVGLLAAPLAAQTKSAASTSATRQVAVHPWQDDAALHAVQFVGSKSGWACGDHGTVWKSQDGGVTWSHLPTPTQASLRSICFLTNQFGWIAGRTTQPFTGIGMGVLLKTSDGGKSWEECPVPLPPLYYVKFFGTDEGVAVGEATSQFPTGVLMTSDGGETWQPVAGAQSAGWLAADFADIERGVVVGDRGRIVPVAEGAVATPRSSRSSFRSMRKVDMVDPLNGWAVGDGGLVLKTINGGVSWQSPTQALPDELNRFADFQTVAARKSKVWISGSPGGCIWHSSDDGQSWRQQQTGHTTPLHAINFSSDETGWAVGAFGTILRTVDGGATWETARAGARRAALLSIHARPDRLPFGALAKYAGDQGFRSVALVLPKWSSTGERDAVGPFERRAQDAVITVGGNALSLGWRLPIALPEVDRNLDQLTAEWQKYTEGRLVEVVVSSLVAELRQWRPSVVVIDEPQPQDAAGRLVVDAVQRAIIEAADPTRYVEHQQLGGLPAWKVERVFRQINSVDSGRINIEPFELLPCVGTTVEQLAGSARGMLFPTVGHAPRREVFAAAVDETEAKFQLASAREFWGGLAIGPGSDARRPQIAIDERQLDQRREQATQQRNFRGIVDQTLDDPQRAAQMIAELRNFTRKLSKADAALQLSRLADDYRRRAQWDLAEATMIELVDFYRDEPIAAEAMLWLLRFWSSEEMSWQRGRKVSLTARRETVDRSAYLSRLQKLAESLGQPQDDPLRLKREAAGELVNLGNLPSQDANQWRSATEQAWLHQAVHLTRVIRQRHGQLFATPQVQLPLASALRRAGNHQLSDSLIRKLVQTTSNANSPLNELAAGELWLAQPTPDAPQVFGTCQLTNTRPMLDGVLGDECWQGAKEMRLTSTDDALAEFNGSYPFILMSGDDQFLYVAASLPRSPDGSQDGPQYKGRQHDADLTGFDRLAINLDVNRDYATSYTIQIDQRGHVSESCWEDSTWNPKLFVAVAGDAEHWRLEVAIPVAELVSAPPRRGTAWAVSFVRTMPCVGQESWPAARPESTLQRAGLVQFK